LTTLSGVWKNVVNGEDPARSDTRCPVAIISERCVKAMTTIDKYDAQWARPMSGELCTSGYDGNDDLFEISLSEIATKRRKGIE
jgi:hypothetical protein